MVAEARLALLYWCGGVSSEEFMACNMEETDFKLRCLQIHKLELFMHSMADATHLTDFQQLRQLSLHLLAIPRAMGLTSMTQLQQLCMTECGLVSMSGVQSCVQLTQLDLSHNKLDEMDPTVLQRLKHLRTLWLNQNRLTCIQGLEPLVHLQSLWLARNDINCICDALDSSLALTEINLAGTLISNFKDVPNMSRLRRLSSLCLSDPHFGESPICALCNYQTYMLYHLQQLDILDTYMISDESRHLAEATYMKKKMYYNMRIKTLKRNTSNVIKRAMEARQAKVSQINLNLNVLLRQKKDVEHELYDLAVTARIGDASSSDTSQKLAQLEEKLHVLKGGITLKTGEIAKAEVMAADVSTAVRETSQSSICRLMVELETGGNIRLEDGKPADMWYSSCVDLINSRFLPSAYADLGIESLRVTRVTRIHNRQLRNRFEERLEQMVNTADFAYKRSLEYLFYGEHPKLAGEFARVMEEGFRPAEEYVTSYGDAAVPLSNSLCISDLSRLKSLAELGKELHGGQVGGGVSSRLLITKVFLARCAQEKQVKCSGNGFSTMGPICQADYEGFSSVYRIVGADGKQRQWFVFDPALVLPEYLVDLEYVSRHSTAEREPSTAQLAELGNGLGAPMQSEAEAVDLANLTRPLLRFAQHCALASPADPYDDVCTAALNMPPALRQRPKVYRITQELLQGVQQRATDFGTIERLNLHGNCIRKLEWLDALRRLRELILCFNEIHKIEGLDELRQLRRLELGFNLIKRIEGLRGPTNLEVLELNNNLIYRLEDIGVLKKHVPDLVELNLHNNAVCEVKSYRSHVIRRLPALILLDRVEVDGKERARAADNITSITPELLKAHAYARKRFNYSLRPNSIAETGSPGGTNEPWWEQAEELELNHQHLRKLHDLELLVNLRRASFCNNELTRLEGLEHCVLLEELSLEDNRIIKLENLMPLVLLTKLDLGKNKIARVESIETLGQLTQLSLEDNEITTLSGLGKLTSLMELYIGNNRISQVKEVQQLKALPKLIILDLSGNPLCETPDYRAYTVFQLRRLKVLDGVGIEMGEQTLAKEKYAGKLTPEALLERLGHSFWEHVHELDLSRSKIRELDALHADGFCNMRELNLDGNLLMEVQSMPRLPALRILRLNHNLIQSATGDSLVENRGTDLGLASLGALEVLQLGYNQISDVPSLRLHHLHNLKVLHLQGNELQRIDGLQSLHQLRELVLDRNKIRQLDPTSLCSLANLRELRIEENGLRSLEHIGPLPQLQMLSLGSNRVSDLAELEKIAHLSALLHIVLANNPVARKQLYRPTLIRRLPGLKLIDGREVSSEERERTDLIFSAEARPSGLLPDQRLLSTKVPLKLTSMNFEMMSGLSMPMGPSIGSVAPSPAPHSAGTIASASPATAEWHPMSASHDEFFLPSSKESSLARSNCRRASRPFDYGHR